jgi:hypothetical protein
MTNVIPLRPAAPPPTLLELVEALRDTQEAIALAYSECEGKTWLLLALAHERNKRLLQRMEIR